PTRTTPTRTLAEMAELAAGFALRVDGTELAGAEVVDGRRYVCLVRTASYEAWLVEWSPASMLAPHDHGGAAGVLHVVDGELVETYRDDKKTKSRERKIEAGYTVRVPASREHEVWNATARPARSIHVYSPPGLVSSALTAPAS
ncbi:MAG TPA: cysteine dioxygenase family protein, partial [Acidimicrobiia bacterium]|nr:cysteine dioxygenase family protein [Acidimicrobiia bacterium]